MSSAFEDGGAIPVEYTCDGDDHALPLTWSDAPPGTAQFALVMDDPDARGFVHWVVFGIPGNVTALQGGALPEGAKHGRADFGRAAYGGPCPPSGTHRYELTLFALDAPLDLTGTPTAADVRNAAANNTLETALLSGTYGR
jgi:Raf kinase inhibitor-like YbhB/YbcL family protein